MIASSFLSRRNFLIQTAAAVAASATAFTASADSPAFRPPVTMFSKIFQTLKLDYEQSASLAADSGLDGIDCPIRKGGQIEPERAVDELPKYIEALGKRKLTMPLITSGIVDVKSPNAQDVLKTARHFGIQLYRLGFIPPDANLAEIKPQLKELGAMNKELGVIGMLENHSIPAYLGGNLNQMYEVVKDLDPTQIGIAFDIGHAIVLHGDEWPTHFERLKNHIKVAYIKDVVKPHSWVPFGQGLLGQTDFFKRMRAMNLTAPVSLHIEYDWSDHGKNKNRQALLAAAKNCNDVARKWLAEA